MASSVRQPVISKSAAASVPETSPLHYKTELPNARAVTGMTALSVEFVAKPEKARSAPMSLSGAITGALQQVTGFAGCLVMVSEHEARLITVVTFWTGHDAQKSCRENTKWVQALLAAYVDRCMRVQIKFAHLPDSPLLAEQSTMASANFLIDESATPEETTCVA